MHYKVFGNEHSRRLDLFIKKGVKKTLMKGVMFFNTHFSPRSRKVKKMFFKNKLVRPPQTFLIMPV